MTTTINSKIKSIEIVKNNISENTSNKLIEKIKKRPLELAGVTYKLKSPLTDHAIYITINDIEIEGKQYPFEVFINSRSLEHQQWITTLTRLISSLFRQHVTYGIDISFISAELKSVADPNGGYFLKNKRVPSLVAEIGDIIENHLIKIGTIENIKNVLVENDLTKFKECPNCRNISLIKMDGCDTCNICGFSKCG